MSATSAAAAAPAKFTLANNIANLYFNTWCRANLKPEVDSKDVSAEFVKQTMTIATQLATQELNEKKITPLPSDNAIFDTLQDAELESVLNRAFTGACAELAGTKPNYFKDPQAAKDARRVHFTGLKALGLPKPAPAPAPAAAGAPRAGSAAAVAATAFPAPSAAPKVVMRPAAAAGALPSKSKTPAPYMGSPGIELAAGQTQAFVDAKITGFTKDSPEKGMAETLDKWADDLSSGDIRKEIVRQLRGYLINFKDGKHHYDKMPMPDLLMWADELLIVVGSNSDSGVIASACSAVKNKYEYMWGISRRNYEFLDGSPEKRMAEDLSKWRSEASGVEGAVRKDIETHLREYLTHFKNGEHRADGKPLQDLKKWANEALARIMPEVSTVPPVLNYPYFMLAQVDCTQVIWIKTHPLYREGMSYSEFAAALRARQ